MSVTRKARKVLRKAGFSRSTAKEITNAGCAVAHDTLVCVCTDLTLEVIHCTANLVKTGIVMGYNKAKGAVKSLSTPKATVKAEVAIQLPKEDEVED